MSFTQKSWPDLLGKDGNEAAERIKKETGFTDVQVLPQNAPVTEDLRTNRVRVFVDEQGKVVTVPSSG